MQVVAFPLQWVEHLPLLHGHTVALTIVCRQLPADVALNKLFKTVITLSEQILQVPAPRHWILKCRCTENAQLCRRHLKTSHIKVISRYLWNMFDVHQTTCEVYWKQKWKGDLAYLYGIEVQVLSAWPTLIKRGKINIHCWPTELNLIRSLQVLQLDRTKKGYVYY